MGTYQVLTVQRWQGIDQGGGGAQRTKLGTSLTFLIFYIFPFSQFYFLNV